MKPRRPVLPLLAACVLFASSFQAAAYARAGGEPKDHRPPAAPTASPVQADFNRDGYADLAVGAPGEDTSTFTDNGVVSVIYGSVTGLVSDSNQLWDVAATGVASDQNEALFGFSATSGDFNGDGYADLAVGVPGQDVSGAGAAGAVVVLYGSAAGLIATGAQMWSQDGAILDDPGSGDNFGFALAAGDLNGDGYADLVAGVPGETVDSKTGAGAANVILGSASGLIDAGNQFWNQDSPGVRESPATDDNFAFAVAVGDVNGDGYGDLVAGVPGEKIGTVTECGAVNVILGSASGLTDVGDELWDQDSTGIKNRCEASDQFGFAVATGDLNGDGFSDLVTGVPYEDLSGGPNAGAANVIYGSADGLTDTGDQIWDQDSSGIKNKAEGSDLFGFTVTTGDYDGDGYADAAFGVPKEDLAAADNCGLVNVIYGSADGLTDSADDVWHQDSSTILDSCETSDQFGYSLASGQFGNGPEDLVVGSPFEDVGSIVDAGMVNVIYGSSSDLTDAGNQVWYQGGGGLQEVTEDTDEFGFGLAEGPGDRALASSSFGRKGQG